MSLCTTSTAEIDEVPGEERVTTVPSERRNSRRDRAPWIPARSDLEREKRGKEKMQDIKGSANAQCDKMVGEGQL